MGILYNKIYKKHFPVKNRYTEFTEQEKEKLCKWARIFKTEVRLREEWMTLECAKCGIKDFRFLTYDTERYDENVMVNMIKQNSFTEEYLAMLNIILYRHKYNAFLSLWVFPMA